MIVNELLNCNIHRLNVGNESTILIKNFIGYRKNIGNNWCVKYFCFSDDVGKTFGSRCAYE